MIIINVFFNDTTNVFDLTFVWSAKLRINELFEIFQGKLIMYDLIVNENGETGEIVFHGSLTIQNAFLIKEGLLNAIEKVRELSINHSDVTGFDITYLQLLISLHNSTAILGKTIKVDHTKPFIAFVHDSGLSGYECLLKDSGTGAEYE